MQVNIRKQEKLNYGPKQSTVEVDDVELDLSGVLCYDTVVGGLNWNNMMDYAMPDREGRTNYPDGFVSIDFYCLSHLIDALSRLIVGETQCR